MKATRSRIETVLKGMTQLELAEIFGMERSNISKLVNNQKDVYVHFEDGEITSIRYDRTVIIERKR